MVAKFSETPVPRPADAGKVRGHAPADLALRGQLILEKASTLEHVTAAEHGLAHFEGVALRIAADACHNRANYFLRDQIFAVIAGDGTVCLRVPDQIAEDLVENGLCTWNGKNLLTKPVTNAWQLKVNWRILLHAYRNITSRSPEQVRRMWSDFVTLK
jgi:hypothetical protein